VALTSCSFRFQSTRPRGARLDPAEDKDEDKDISIHAPTRGATYLLSTGQALRHNFNPRAHAGRDGSFHMAAMTILSFQSTRPRGARPEKNTAVNRFVAISIHAPTRGATLLIAILAFRKRHFNPRAHAGRDFSRGGRVHKSTRFQSTRPRGARPARALGLRQYCLFQSTRPRGARHVNIVIRGFDRRISIHAPTRGATWLTRETPGASEFQSTRPRGARLDGVVDYSNV